MEYMDIPRGAWIEEVEIKGRKYYYLRWREDGKKVSRRLTPQEAQEIASILKTRRESIELPSFEELVEQTKRLADQGDEIAKKLLKRINKEKALIKRLLYVLDKSLEH